MKIILASSSPRRKELLTLMGVEFAMQKPLKDEDMTQKLSIGKLSEILSKQKAQEVFDLNTGDRLVVGSDCMVFFKGKKLGKPKSREDAFNMLNSMNNKWHKVVTGLCVLVEQNGQKRQYLTHDVTKVKFKKFTDKALNEYLDSGEYKDKAGAYAIQGSFGKFVEKLNGNLSTVVGIPTHKLHDILKQEKILN